MGKRCPSWVGPALVTASQMTPILGTPAAPTLMVSGSTLVSSSTAGQREDAVAPAGHPPRLAAPERHCPLRVYLQSPRLLPCGHLFPSCSGGWMTLSLALGLQWPAVASLISLLWPSVVHLSVEMLLPILGSLKFLKICKSSTETENWVFSRCQSFLKSSSL